MGRRGPSKTPTAELKKRGSWIADGRESEFQPSAGVPFCPDWLSDIGRAKWDERVAILSENDGLSVPVVRPNVAVCFLPCLNQHGIVCEKLNVRLDVIDLRTENPEQRTCSLIRVVRRIMQEPVPVLD